MTRGVSLDVRVLDVKSGKVVWQDTERSAKKLQSSEVSD